MRVTAECKHGLDEDTCSLCLHPNRQPETREADYVTTARFEGHCRDCDLPIHPGQAIAAFHGRFVHEGCL